MPSGRVHLKIEAGLLFGWTALAGFLLASRVISVEGVIAFVLAYAFSALFLSPDLDLARSRAFRRWGLARWLWIPYALLFRHRRLSHHPILGFVTRLAYLGAMIVVVGAVAVVVIGRPVRVGVPSAEALLATAVGAYLPNLTHVLVDRVVSGWRRRFAKRRL